MSEDGRVSVSILIEQLRLQGLLASEDSLQHLRDHDLIEKPKRLGRGKGSAYTQVQSEHIRNVLRLQVQLGTKWSFPELAFWMAANRLHNVPVKLVAKHIDSSVQVFIRTVNRLTDRYAKGRMQPEDTPAHKMARYATYRLIKVKDETSRQASLVAQDVLEICLNLWYFNLPPSKSYHLLRRIVYAFYDAPVADQQFLLWQQRLADHATLFSENFRANRLVASVQKALVTKPKIIVLAAKDALVGFKVLRGGLEPVPDMKPHLGKASTYLYTRMARAMIPVLAALSIDIQLDDSRNPILLRLRAGDDLGIKSFIHSLTNQTYT
ncbi:MAG TPA: hypothetical protein VGX91_12015 [Candidatus Cybelea sp.]|nr:hypothetical protein [Candidatus Cybelea sp.]